MTRLLAAAAAGALFLLLRLTTPAPPVIGVGLLAVGLSAVAIAAAWRWAATSAAVVFLIGYAAALAIEQRPVDVGAALGFGLALVLLLGAVDLSARARGASLHGRVVGATLGRFIGARRRGAGGRDAGHGAGDRAGDRADLDGGPAARGGRGARLRLVARGPRPARGRPELARRVSRIRGGGVLGGLGRGAQDRHAVGRLEAVPVSLRHHDQHAGGECDGLRPVGGHDREGRGAVEDLHQLVALRVCRSQAVSPEKRPAKTLPSRKGASTAKAAFTRSAGVLALRVRAAW